MNPGTTRPKRARRTTYWAAFLFGGGGWSGASHPGPGMTQCPELVQNGSKMTFFKNDSTPLAMLKDAFSTISTCFDPV